MRTNTPAVTRVDECTKAETGVGAAMAAGSQLENGICALLVIAATDRYRMSELLGVEELRIIQCP